MDQIKTGKFIAQLRRQHGLTQEALGEKLGVTNKTVSRWENGNYLPDIEMLQLLSKEFQVSINELLSGERLTDQDFRKKADENILEASKERRFSFAERKAFFKKKWRKEHIPLFVLLFVILVAAVVLPIIFGKTYLLGLVPLIAIGEYAYQNNRMMIYVEHKLYD